MELKIRNHKSGGKDEAGMPDSTKVKEDVSFCRLLERQMKGIGHNFSDPRVVWQGQDQ